MGAGQLECIAGEIGGLGMVELRVYENTISWADEKTALPPVRDPVLAFEQIFSGFDPAESEAKRRERVARRKSVLDYVREETIRLSGRLDRADAAKLDQLTSGIRDIEKRLQAIGGPGAGCGTDKPADPGLKYDLRGKLINDIIVAALQCDVTRVISHMLAPPYPNISYGFINATAGSSPS